MNRIYKKNTSFKTASLAVVLIVLTSLFSSVFAQGYVTLGTQEITSTEYDLNPNDGGYSSFKLQIIYTSAEIIAAGGAAGNIDRLAWDVVSKNFAGDFYNYTISIKHVSYTAVPNPFETGLSTVATLPTYTQVSSSFNEIIFDTPFNWNGTDNIIIEVCSNNIDWLGAGSVGTAWNYTGASGCFAGARDDVSDFCPLTNWQSETNAYNSNLKPRIRFYMQQAAVACNPPTSLTVYNTQTTSALVSWTNPSAGFPASYTVEVRTSGAAGSGPTGFVTSFSIVHPTNTTTITGLNASTAYAAYVKTDCGGSGTSLYTSGANFTTPCNSTSVPYTQNFDGATLPNLPICTSSQDLNGYTTWTSVTAPTSYTGNILRYTYDFGGQPADDWFYTVGINLTAGTEYRLKFKYGARNPSYPERLKVCYGNAADAASMVTTLTNQTNITTDVNYAKVDFTPASNGVYYFGFHAYSLANNDWLYLDDIDINVKPFCNVITNANAFGFSPTTAIITWTTAVPSTPPGNPSAYQIELRTAGAAGSGAIGLFSTYTTTHPTNVLTFTGLTANTGYTTYIKTDCSSNDYSLWSSVIFTTPCVATSVPYTENFDAAIIPNLNSCTYKQDLNGGNTWLSATAPASYSGKVLQYNAHATLQANDWFYTSGLNLVTGTTYRFSFKYGNSNASFTEKLAVKYGTSNSAETMTNSLFNFTTINSASPQTASIDFSPATSGVYYFGFNAFSIANQSSLYVDDISLIVAPVCASPSNNTVTDFTSTSVALSWTSPSVGIPLSYEIEIRTSGLGGSGATGLASTSTITHPTNITTITGLTAATSYTAFIRTNCGSGDYGAWQSIGSFTTPCSPSSIPYSENFNSTTYPNIPNCTYKQDLNGVSTWVVFNPSALSYADFTDNCLIFEYDVSIAANNWFYTKGLNLTSGITYNINYKYRADAANTTFMNVSCGLSPLANAMINSINTHNSIAATTTISSATFTPTTSGVYYFGFKTNSAGNSHFILLDDINITGTAANSNSSLSALASSVGTLAPAFNASTFNYTVALPFGSTGTATLNPTVTAGTSTTVITSATNVTGSSPANVATVVVTAQSGATSTYTVTYNVATANTNSSLSALTSSVGTLVPAFNASTFNYTITLPFGSTGTATLNPTVAAGTSTTAITSATNVTGSSPANIATVVVTAQSGATSTYTVTYSVASASSDASLSSLTTSIGSLSPSFSASITSYTVYLPAGSSGTGTLTGIVNNASATITSNIAAVDISSSDPFDNTATITITAQDGSTKTYTVSFVISVGIEKTTSSKFEMNLSPNPNSGLSILKLTNLNSETIDVVVVYVSGQIVIEKTIKTNNNQVVYDINLTNEPKGVYFVKVKTNSTTVVKRLITY